MRVNIFSNIPWPKKFINICMRENKTVFMHIKIYITYKRLQLLNHK